MSVPIPYTLLRLQSSPRWRGAGRQPRLRRVERQQQAARKLPSEVLLHNEAIKAREHEVCIQLIAELKLNIFASCLENYNSKRCKSLC